MKRNLLTSYNGKTIWILGASSGIGAALALELASAGARLIVSARRLEPLQELAASLPPSPAGAHMAIACDVSDAESVNAALSTIAARAGRLDSAVFMAALYEPMRFGTMDRTAIKRMLDINIGGAFNFVETLLPFMEAQGSGQIVLCGSVAAYRGLPNGQPYCATKAAIASMAESLYVEKPALDIRLISPGFVRTDLTARNDFKMPMMIEPEQAARSIRKGLEAGNFEIHFPKAFTRIMKLLRILPHRLYFAIARKMAA